jgi:hypothetical protein
MAWLIIDAATAESIRRTPICPGQQFDPIPLKDGTFYLGDHPLIKTTDRSKAALAHTKLEFDSQIEPKQIKALQPDQAIGEVVGEPIKG